MHVVDGGGSGGPEDLAGSQVPQGREAFGVDPLLIGPVVEELVPEFKARDQSMNSLDAKLGEQRPGS